MSLVLIIVSDLRGRICIFTGSSRRIRAEYAEAARQLARRSTSKPEQFMDARFFQELEKEGFIQKLWK
jgi:hypothetical protein